MPEVSYTRMKRRLLICMLKFCYEETCYCDKLIEIIAIRIKYEENLTGNLVFSQSTDIDNIKFERNENRIMSWNGINWKPTNIFKIRNCSDYVLISISSNTFKRSKDRI